jgi:oligopeptide transport system ATP-binding protein
VKGAELYTIPGVPPDPSRPLPGCPFAPRCEFAVQPCTTAAIGLASLDDAQASACVRMQRQEIRIS